MILALLRIGESGAIGRHALATEVGLGEGAVRTVIKWLKSENYITIKASGCRLAPRGERAYSELRKSIPQILTLPRTELTVGRVQVAILVRKRADRVRTGLEQRDSSIVAGASGATTYIVKNSRFEVPGSPGDAEKAFPGEVWGELRGRLEPRDGDVVIVCGSDEKRTSVLGAMSAALTLLV